MGKHRAITAAVLKSENNISIFSNIFFKELYRGQVFVKIHFSGVCRSQLMEVRGGRGHDPWLPHLLGHEGSGIVLEIGPGVSKVKPGDEVILTWIKGDGLDAPGARYRCGDEVINSGKVTTFSTHTVVSENRLVRKPSCLEMDEAILFGCALPTGAGMVLNQAQPTPGSNVAVLGLGGVGMGALMALSCSECKQIIAIDVSDAKLELAKEFEQPTVSTLTIPMCLLKSGR